MGLDTPRVIFQPKWAAVGTAEGHCSPKASPCRFCVSLTSSAISAAHPPTSDPHLFSLGQAGGGSRFIQSEKFLCPLA